MHATIPALPDGIHYILKSGIQLGESTGNLGGMLNRRHGDGAEQGRQGTDRRRPARETGLAATSGRIAGGTQRASVDSA